MNRAQFLQDRKQGVGGSDIASLFNIGWGCKRRLFYDKTNTPEDFPRESSLIMELGNVLEPWFAERYAKETGRTVDTAGTLLQSNLPELRVNVDRIVYGAGESDFGTAHAGVLEIKSVGRAAFYKYKRDGLPEDYVLQLQSGMLASGLSWGAFCIGCRDSGELVHWDVERSEFLCNEIAAEVPRFWRQVELGNESGMGSWEMDGSIIPPRLEPDDRRCQSCEFRTTCQGNALIQLEGDGEKKAMPELLPLLAEYDTRKGLYDQAEELLDETKEELRDKIGDTQAAVVGKRTVYYRQSAGKQTVDGKGLLKQYAELWEVRAADLALAMQLTTTAQVESEMFKIGYPKAESFVSTGKPYRTLRIF